MEKSKQRLADMIKELMAGESDCAQMIDELMKAKTFAYACGALYAMERASISIKDAMKANGADPEFMIEGLRRTDDSMVATVVFDPASRREINQ